MTGEYRAYMLDENDQILKRIEIDAKDDASALRIAQQYVDGHDVEIWQGHSIVRRLKHRK